MCADLHRDNHYVPRSYLKHWSHDGSKLWTYRILVSKTRVPLWREASVRGVAYHEHLYTKIAASGESDDIERWLDAEFEAPAEPVVAKVIAGRQLYPADWKVLVRFFAAQDVRTPARLIENLQRWSETLPTLIQNTLADSIAEYAAMMPGERAAIHEGAPSSDDIPFRTSIQKDAERGGGWIKGEIISGRRLWLWSIQHVLNGIVAELLRHRWTVLTAPSGIEWLTSDDPAIRLNFTSETEYDFGGGWGSVGTDLLLPLSPRHLLFTQIGKPVPQRGMVLEPDKAVMVQRLIAEHAHRFIFARTPNPLIEHLRPRTVDADAVKQEALQWQHWHIEQSESERGFLGDGSGPRVT